MVYLKLLRVKHYLKNLLIFFPLLFSLNLFEPIKLLATVMGFISFSLLTSVVYIFNDIKDMEEDRNHLSKRNRPLASGAVSISKAVAIASFIGIFAVASLVLLWTVKGNWGIFLFFFLYLANNALYTCLLKQLPILDVGSIAVGFLLRVMFGASIISVSVSPFLYLTILMGALYFGFGKRLGEYRQAYKRQVLKRYEQGFLEKIMTLCLGLTVMFYCLWTLHLGDGYAILKATVPIILLLFMRYQLLIERGGDGDPIEAVWRDKWLMGSSMGYGALLVFLLYG